MKQWTIKEYRIQLLWPEAIHRSSSGRHEVFLLADTRIRVCWGPDHWLIGAVIFGFGIGADWMRSSPPNDELRDRQPEPSQISTNTKMPESKSNSAAIAGSSPVPCSPIEALDEGAAKRLLHEIADRFGIGMDARTRSTILANLANVIRRSECLSQVEYHHTSLEPDDDGEMVEECPLNWSDTPEQYRARYEAMLVSENDTLTRPDQRPDGRLET